MSIIARELGHKRLVEHFSGLCARAPQERITKEGETAQKVGSLGPEWIEKQRRKFTSLCFLVVEL